MSELACVAFRFLAGNNLGAVFTLPPGEYTLGSSPECDIQLDEADLHAEVGLKVDAALKVWVRLISGRVLLNGNELTHESELFPDGAVLAIGFSALTHLKEGQTIADVDLSILGLAGKKEEPEAAQERVSQEGQPPAPDAEKAQEAEPGDKPFEQEPAEKVRISRALLTAAGLVILFLALLSLIAGSALFGERAQRREALAAAQAYLDENGFQAVTLSFGDDVLIFKGEVPSQADFNRFASGLPRLPYAAVLQVEVRDELLTAIERACAVHGASVRAEYLDKEQGKIVLYGYVRDPYLEAALIKALAAELKLDGLSPVFTDEQELKKLIARLQPLDFKVPLVTDSFKVYYEGDLTLDERELLKKLEKALSAEVKAPVCFDSIKNRGRSQIELYAFTNRDLNLATTQEKSDNDTEATERTALESARGFNPADIVGVTMQPMRFVSMADGSRYFEGSVMADGAVLKEISVHALTFERNGELYIHELK